MEFSFIKRLFLLGVLIVFYKTGFSQIINGRLSNLQNSEIRLEVFSGFKSYLIGRAQTDEKGNFTIPFSKEHYGVAYLISNDNKPFFIILQNEDIEIVGASLYQKESIKVLKSIENKSFGQYAIDHPKREQAITAWDYLEKFYKNDSLFQNQNAPLQAIQNEKSRIKNEDQAFLNLLPKNSYVSWYLPTRKLISDVSIVTQYRQDEIPFTVKSLRSIDYSDERLYRSGLFKDAIDNHFWLLENSGKPLDSVFKEMSISIDAVLNSLIKDEKKYNEVTEYLFDLLEKHSLFQASEYLALKVLNEKSCTVDNNIARQLETYRAMKKGNTAPQIRFEKEYILSQRKNHPKNLSDIQSDYIVVVFGASWCPKCAQELPEIAKLYPKWKEQKVEVVFIALEDNKNQFTEFVKPFPFISYSDIKKWQSPIANGYYVFGTPTMFLLDKKRTILLRPNSVKQMDAWVDWFLIQGNLKK
jgi:thiol-disulfide isomerase/thioredoxin